MRHTETHIRKVLLYFVLAITIIGCRHKKEFVYDLVVSSNADSTRIESKVTNYELLGITDTIAAYLSGKVVSYDSSCTAVIQEPLVGAIVLAVDSYSGVRFCQVTDSIGKYSFELSASKYDIKILHVHYTQLIVRNVELHGGDMYRLDARLGQGSYRDSTVDINTTRKPH
jgi:hypothetical protein